MRQPTLLIPKLSPRRSWMPFRVICFPLNERVGLWHGVFVKRARVYILFWQGIAVKWFDQLVNKFSADNKGPWICASNVFSSVNHLVRQDKSPKRCTNKGPETNFPEIFDDLFNYKRKLTWQNYYDKWNSDMPIYLLVCMGLWALQFHS